jgi:hypothetical protein
MKPKAAIFSDFRERLSPENGREESRIPESHYSFSFLSKD